jgi:hypothetical protein
MPGTLSGEAKKADSGVGHHVMLQSPFGLERPLRSGALSANPEVYRISPLAGQVSGAMAHEPRGHFVGTASSPTTMLLAQSGESPLHDRRGRVGLARGLGVPRAIPQMEHRSRPGKPREGVDCWGPTGRPAAGSRPRGVRRGK